MSEILKEHLGYVSDAGRTELFKTAVMNAVRPGDHVVDLGCGSGVLGLLCLHAGAGRVTAIDSTPALEIARESLTRAGWGPKVDFIHGYSTQVELAFKADVVICDNVGYFGFDYRLIQTLADARRRFLKPGGRLIPSRLRLLLGVVESEKCWRLADGWQASGIPAEYQWLRRYGVNTKHAVNLAAVDVLAGPVELACVDLHADNPDFYSWTAELTMARDGLMHGLAGWFECELVEGVWMTNSPTSAQAIKRQQAFLPIELPLPVKAGDVVSATVMARPVDSLTAWEVRHPASGKTFRQSTWQGDLLMHDHLFKSSPDYVPQLTRLAHARQFVLGSCDGHRTVRQIQEKVLLEYSNLFPSPSEITRFVMTTLGKNTA